MRLPGRLPGAGRTRAAAGRVRWRTPCGHGDFLARSGGELSATASSLPVMATHWTIGADATDPAALAAFWAAALDYIPEPADEDPDCVTIIDPDGTGPTIDFLRVPEPKTSKNRFHIDIRVAGKPPWNWTERETMIRTTVDRLVQNGAVKLREEAYSSEGGEILGHVVMLDPEGNEFCVA